MVVFELPNVKSSSVPVETVLVGLAVGVLGVTTPEKVVPILIVAPLVVHVTTVPEVIEPPVAADRPAKVTASFVLNGAVVAVNAIVRIPVAIVRVVH